jgi:hypothetical protein
VSVKIAIRPALITSMEAMTTVPPADSAFALRADHPFSRLAE